MRIIRSSGRYLIQTELDPDEAETVAAALGGNDKAGEELRRLASLARVYQQED